MFDSKSNLNQKIPYGLQFIIFIRKISMIYLNAYSFTDWPLTTKILQLTSIIMSNDDTRGLIEKDYVDFAYCRRIIEKRPPK